MKIVAIYERVSTTHQRHDAQDLPLKRWCRSHGIRCHQYRMYKDVGSGKDSHRPELQRLLRHVQDGKVKMIVVFSLQRLSRSLLDGVKILTTLLENNVEVISLSENLELKGPSGRLVCHVLLSIYEWQREFQNESIKNGIAARRKQGKPIGRPRNNRRLTQIRKWHTKGMTAIDIAERLGCTRANVYVALKKTA